MTDAPETPLDRAMRLAGGDVADGRVVDALLNARLCLLLKEAPGEDGALSPLMLELEAGPTALAFDDEARLAAFGGGEDYAEVPGRALIGMLAGQGVNLAVNPGVAPSELFHGAEALDWMAQVSAAEAQGAEGRIEALSAPRGASEALISALDVKLAALGAWLSEAWLVTAATPEGPRLALALAERETGAPQAGRALEAAAEARRRAVVLAVSESARLADPETSLEVFFAPADAPALAAARRTGLGFEIPEPEAPAVPGAAPGMDPSRPPKLR
ncbi:SseB family protein [Albimonas sp. CAU 1670]|uniref:SseB family protein n=1 Tax=Albimonas sp. CAU 1670 TaxID=3032599 RepID=UPI0023DB2C40|nr:SseB family protein [Albimonas sp. CAU 1670]MDF2233288.1 SseB family protein [Albimonas sp. CAU 1670]